MTRTTAPSLLIVARQGDRWYRSEVDARKAKHPNLTVVEMDGLTTSISNPTTSRRSQVHPAFLGHDI